MERRLAAILCYDVVAYSRAMSADERGTLERLKKHRAKLIDPKAAQYAGRTIKLIGDGALMEFASVVDAMAFAVGMQFATAEHDAELPEHQRLLYRIGINVGDVIVEGNDIYGEGVNVAARLEGIAEPGGICIRRNVRNQVRGKLDLDFEDLGEIEVKNIERPVRAFHVVMNDKAKALAAAPPDRSQKLKSSARRWRVPAVIALALALLAGFVWWPPLRQEFEPLSADKMAYPLPDKPSIAVMPFDNLSQDPEQDYFAEGMTDDLITDLSKVSGLFVISRTSTAVYKSKPVDPRAVGRELGVRYLLQGSVRRDGEQLRINARLIDITSGGLVWADRFDGSAGEVLALQDRIASRIVSTLEVALSPAEKERLLRQETRSAEAHDRFLRGYQLFRHFTPEANAAAQAEFRAALEIDPAYARAEALLGWTHWMATISGWGDEPLEVALEHAEQALALNDTLGTAHALRGKVYLWQRQHEEAEAELRRAVSVEPSYANGYGHLGDILAWSGKPDEALGALDRGLRMSPNDHGWILTLIGYAHFIAGRLDVALSSLDRALARNPDYFWAHVCRAAVLAAKGKRSEAGAAVSKVLEINPEFSLGFFKSTAPFRRKEDRQRYVSGLREAGLPE